MDHLDRFWEYLSEQSYKGESEFKMQVLPSGPHEFECRVNNGDDLTFRFALISSPTSTYFTHNGLEDD